MRFSKQWGVVKMPPACSQNEPAWMVIAKKELGESEIVGIKANPRIIEYHKSVSLHASSDEVPWCSSFVNWCMMGANKPRTHSAAALSWLHYGKELTKPVLGCIVVFQHHVGFYIGETSDCVNLLGGNQHDKVSIAPFLKKNVLSYRFPL